MRDNLQEKEVTKLEIYNMLGQKVHSQMLDNKQGKHKIEIETLPKGLYVVIVQQGKLQQRIKFMKE